MPIQGSILDAGGGTGRVAKSFIGKASQVIVYDLSFDMLQQATEIEKLDRVNGHTETFPFPDASFERVLMVDALHHVISQEQTIREMWRVLKPGGLLIIEEPDLNLFSVKIVALLEKVALMRSHFLSPEQIHRSLASLEGAKDKIEKEGFNAWVIAGKSG